LADGGGPDALRAVEAADKAFGSWASRYASKIHHDFLMLFIFFCRFLDRLILLWWINAS
jgi:hypothetical protein